MEKQSYSIQQHFFISQQQLLNPTNVVMETEPFHLADTPNNIEFNVILYPNGRSPAETGRFLVFLQINFPEDILIYANYTVVVGGTHKRNFDHCFKSSSSFGGVLCDQQSLFSPTSLLVDDQLSIEIDGKFDIHQNSTLNTLRYVRASPNYYAALSRASNLPSPRGKTAKKAVKSSASSV